ncbi:MAG: hypothetical protein ACREFP_04435 [Acetobacteraceae bacterium]
MPGERQMVPEAERSSRSFSSTGHDSRSIPSIVRARFSRAEYGEQSSLFAAFLSAHLNKETRGFRAPFTDLAVPGSPPSSTPELAAEHKIEYLTLWRRNERARPRPPIPLKLRPAEWVWGPPYDAA